MEKFSDTKVLILAAGFGKRLHPLTKKIPKPLISIGTDPILTLIIEKLLKTGFDQSQLVVNTHYLADQIEDYLKNNYPKVKISHEKEIRGTGGALFGAKNYLYGHNLLIHNADILSEENIADFLNSALKSENDAVMMLREDKRAENYGSIRLDENGCIVDIAGIIDSNKHSNLMFTGIHFIRKIIWDFMEECHFCSIINKFYIPAIKDHRKISSFMSSAYWNDIGNMESLADARLHFTGSQR